ncbi:MAG TPA: hypothetical protein VFY10_12980 [Dehalococcoidia bacterium]|nr:hypothetical protein [Dehalococcoidia bacterium]
MTLVSKSIERHALQLFIPDVLDALNSIKAGDRVRIVEPPSR